ncbi:glyoxylate reductase/hydroxypyruvate reductase-like [Diadema antillarum]|uniref:glyoxylate reductase/hydroxypyruvate reductase-like n=1 Tax=Diadema antillarum TaxID=105358 RepID=UPI003A8A1628
MASRETESDRPVIICAFVRPSVEGISCLKDLQKDYETILWEEFLVDPERYSQRVLGLVTSPYHPPTLTEREMQFMPNLRVYSTASVGLDHVNLPLLKKFGVRLGYTPDPVTKSTADMGFTLMLAAARRLPEMQGVARSYHAGSPLDAAKSRQYLGQNLHDSTLGIVGLGNIGLEVAKRAMGFDMKVLYHNRRQRSTEIEQSVRATYCPTLEALLPQVDFLILTAPLTEETRNMMRKDRFKLMKPTSILINIARGPLVNTDDLLEALESGTISGAALDTVEPEPLPNNHVLFTMPNVIVTPHCGVFTTEAFDRMFTTAVENLLAGIRNSKMVSEMIL